MTAHARGWRPPRRRPLLPAMLALVLACVVAPAAARAAEEYLLEDAKLTARTLYFVQQGATQVTVADDDFKLTIGQHVISGDRAVLWITEDSTGQVVRRKMTIYVEGRARVVEPNGTTTVDRTFVVRVNQEGRLAADGKVQEAKLDDLPIYARALAARKQAESPPAPRTSPALVRATSGPTTAPATGAAGPEVPITLPGKPKKRPSHSLIAIEARRPASRPTSEPAPPTPVEFQADQVTSEEISPTLRAIVLRGHVYLSEGSADSQLYLELRSQSAVLFTEKNVPKKDVHSPLSPQLQTFGQNESVSGVYLEGDVIISRGERVMQGPKAYYDFTTDRGTLPDPVFRVIQEQRNIPMYIRAKEAKILSARESYFRDAQVTTSDFYTPSYAIKSSDVYFKDTTPYDAAGHPLGEQKAQTVMKDATFRVADVPLFYWPVLSGDFTESETPLRRLNVGHNGQFGTGFESEWDLFRLLGLLRPDGVHGGVEADYYSNAAILGVNFNYSRRDGDRQYTGYDMLYGIYDSKGKDRFGDELKDIPAPHDRGRALLRHKEYLPNDWQIQFELSYLSDKNFLREFFRDEYWCGKDQETLLYAEKQRDNWAFTALLQYRLNSFQTQTESWPDLSFYLLGEPLAGGLLTYYNEDHAGFKRWVPADGLGMSASDVMARGDTRHELDMPLKFGPVNVTPYVTGRATAWSDQPDVDGESFRPFGQAGVKSNMDIWRVYNDVHSRLWDLNRIKHIITPEVVAWMTSSGGVKPDQLFPMDGGIEKDWSAASGASFGLYQRLQTKRGEPGKEQTVDWMRLAVVGTFFSKHDNNLTMPADGRFFFSRPEDSLARDNIDVDYTWNISNATAFLADLNYDTERNQCGRVDLGFAVQRNPRLRYYFGVREIHDLNTTVGTFGFNYKLNAKYSLSFFEQYDFAYDGGKNLVTTFSIIRKFERWYAALSFEYDRTQGSFGAYITLWPEGVPEIKIGSGRMSPLGNSSMN